MNVILTGANRGIGLELAKKLVARGDKLTCLVRNVSEELKSLDCKIVEDFDFSNDEFLNKLPELEGNYDLAIFNAGVGMIGERPFSMEKMAHVFKVNAISQFMLADAFLDKGLSKENSKFAFISSWMGSIEANEGEFHTYRASKTALNSLVKSLSFETMKKGIACMLLHPGYVKTDMTGHNGEITAEQSAQNILDSIEMLKNDGNNKFFHTTEKSVIPW